MVRRQHSKPARSPAPHPLLRVPAVLMRTTQIWAYLAGMVAGMASEPVVAGLLFQPVRKAA